MCKEQLLSLCPFRSCSVCVSTTPVEKTAMTAALVTIRWLGTQELSLRETPVKVCKTNNRKVYKKWHHYLPLTLFLCLTCLSECNCHNKAVDCFYNQTVSELSLSLNTRGLLKGGGVCINCQQNTAGVNCETCRDGYYKPSEVRTYPSISPSMHLLPLIFTVMKVTSQWEKSWHLSTLWHTSAPPGDPKMFSGQRGYTGLCFPEGSGSVPKYHVKKTSRGRCWGRQIFLCEGVVALPQALPRRWRSSS